MYVFTMGNTHMQKNLPPHSSLSDLLQASLSPHSIVLIERALELSMLVHLDVPKYPLFELCKQKLHMIFLIVK